ncbi:MAG: IS1595 family transposase [Gammaproteobacteria bacterium]|nr:IS1595 family transposase [Gammaproteobacteria bacterium]
MKGGSEDQISLLELMERYPDEAAARKFFEDSIWPSGKRCCSRCGSLRTFRVSHPTMPYKCTDCRRYFSIRTGTVLESSNLPLRKWLVAIHLELDHPKGLSSPQVAKSIGITQSTSWHLGHRIREALAQEGKGERFDGPVEVDETFVGGKKKNMSKERREKYRGRGTIGKTPIAGMLDRATGRVSAEVVPDTTKDTLQRFVLERIKPGVTVVFTDELKAYIGLPNHKSVNHSAFEFVRGDVHTNSLESFWAGIKRSFKGVYHKWSRRHLQRYIDEHVGRFNLRGLGTIAKMERLASLMVGTRLKYDDLVGKSPQAARAPGAG